MSKAGISPAGWLASLCLEVIQSRTQRSSQQSWEAIPPPCPLRAVDTGYTVGKTNHWTCPLYLCRWHISWFFFSLTYEMALGQSVSPSIHPCLHLTHMNEMSDQGAVPGHKTLQSMTCLVCSCDCSDAGCSSGSWYLSVMMFRDVSKLEHQRDNEKCTLLKIEPYTGLNATSHL